MDNYIQQINANHKNRPYRNSQKFDQLQQQYQQMVQKEYVLQNILKQQSNQQGRYSNMNLINDNNMKRSSKGLDDVFQNHMMDFEDFYQRYDKDSKQLQQDSYKNDELLPIKRGSKQNIQLFKGIPLDDKFTGQNSIDNKSLPSDIINANIQKGLAKNSIDSNSNQSYRNQSNDKLYHTAPVEHNKNLINSSLFRRQKTGDEYEMHNRLNRSQKSQKSKQRDIEQYSLQAYQNEDQLEKYLQKKMSIKNRNLRNKVNQSLQQSKRGQKRREYIIGNSQDSYSDYGQQQQQEYLLNKNLRNQQCFSPTVSPDHKMKNQNYQDELYRGNQTPQSQMKKVDSQLLLQQQQQNQMLLNYLIANQQYQDQLLNQQIIEQQNVPYNPYGDIQNTSQRDIHNRQSSTQLHVPYQNFGINQNRSNSYSKKELNLSSQKKKEILQNLVNEKKQSKTNVMHQKIINDLLLHKNNSRSISPYKEQYSQRQIGKLYQNDNQSFEQSTQNNKPLNVNNKSYSQQNLYQQFKKQSQRDLHKPSYKKSKQKNNQKVQNQSLDLMNEHVKEFQNQKRHSQYLHDERPLKPLKKSYEQISQEVEQKFQNKKIKNKPSQRRIQVEDDRPIRPLKKNLEDIIEESEALENSNKKLPERNLHQIDDRPIKPLQNNFETIAEQEQIQSTKRNKSNNNDKPIKQKNKSYKKKKKSLNEVKKKEKVVDDYVDIQNIEQSENNQHDQKVCQSINFDKLLEQELKKEKSNLVSKSLQQSKKTFLKKNGGKTATNYLLKKKQKKQILDQQNQKQNQKDFQNKNEHFKKKQKQVSNKKIDDEQNKPIQEKTQKEDIEQEINNRVFKQLKKIEKEYKLKEEELEKEKLKIQEKEKFVQIELRKLDEQKQEFNKQKKVFINELEKEKVQFKKFKEDELKKISKQRKSMLRNIKKDQSKSQKKELNKKKSQQDQQDSVKQSKKQCQNKLKQTIDVQKKQIEELKNQISKMVIKKDQNKKKVQSERKKIKLIRTQTEKEQDEQSSRIISNKNFKYNRKLSSTLKMEEAFSNKKKILHQKKTLTEINSDINYENQSFLSNEDSHKSFLVENFKKKKQNLSQQNKLVQDLLKTFKYKNEDIRLGIKANQENYKYDNNKYYKQYQQHEESKEEVQKKIKSKDGKITKKYKGGIIQREFLNGVKSFHFPNKYTIVNFNNGDIKQVLPDGTIIYFYKEYDITQLTIPDKEMEIYRFANEQLEFHHKDNKKEIKFKDGTEKFIFPNKEEFTFFPDKTTQSINSKGIKLIEYDNGKYEIVYKNNKKIKIDEDGNINESN